MSSSEEERQQEQQGALRSIQTSAMTTKHQLIQIRKKPLSSGPSNYRASWKPKSTSSSRDQLARPISALSILLLLVLVFLFLLTSSVPFAEALNCYHCSSVNNPDCDEPFTGRANFNETNCEQSIGRPAKVCRKIIQYIESKKVVIRSCGYIDEHEEKDRKPMCYKRSGTFAIMMESCNCYTDNCNYSASLVPNQSVLFLLTLLAAISSSLTLLNNYNKGVSAFAYFY